MFRPEKITTETFEGYRVVAFRQGRCNLAERTLRGTEVIFAPQLGVAGVFLPSSGWGVDEGLLRAAWQTQGAPAVRRPGPGDALLFGRVMPVRTLAFAGYDDLWQEEGSLVCACRRRLEPERLPVRLATYGVGLLSRRAEELLAEWAPGLAVCPRRVVVRPLRSRILGQCTRDGEIRLNPSLLRWPDTILAETLAHELVHLTHFNHSPAFWRALSELLPDWLPRSLVHYLEG